MSLAAPPAAAGLGLATRAPLVPRSGSGSLIPPPSAIYGAPGPYVWDTASARKVPAVQRALALYAGMCKQMELEAFKGYSRIDPQPPIVQRQDPTPGNGRPWFVHVHVEDYLLNGNALSLVTNRNAAGWPTAMAWLPASWVFILWTPGAVPAVSYYYAPPQGRAVELPLDDVVHIKRGADRSYPVRGVGVVEEGLNTLDRVAMEEEFERSTLNGSAVPSVAIITPQAVLADDVATQAKADWLTKYGGPNREPAILPNGSEVIPLAWSPADTQLVEARKASLQDIANMFNLDGYWLGAPVAGMTYRTAGPQYQQILRTSLEPILADFEDAWSAAWLPRGTDVRFRRSTLLRDDLATTAAALAQLAPTGAITIAEQRLLLGLPPQPPDELADPEPAEPDTAGAAGDTPTEGDATS
jgi:HK97 family phage portal protein